MRRINWFSWYQKFRYLGFGFLCILLATSAREIYFLWNPGSHEIVLMTTVQGIKPGTLVVSPFSSDKKMGFCNRVVLQQENQQSYFQVFLSITRGHEDLFTPEAQIWIETSAPSARFLMASLATTENQQQFESDFKNIQKDLKSLSQELLEEIKHQGKEDFAKANLHKEWELIFQDEMLKTCIYAAIVEEVLHRIDFWKLVSSDKMKGELKESMEQVWEQFKMAPLLKSATRDSLTEGYKELNEQMKNPMTWIFLNEKKMALKVGKKMLEGASAGGLKESSEQLSVIIKQHPEIYKNPAWTAFWELQQQGLTRNSLNFMASLWNNDFLMQHLQAKYGSKAKSLLKETILNIKENPKALNSVNLLLDKIEPIATIWGKKILLDEKEEQMNPLLIALIREKLSGESCPVIYVVPSEKGGKSVSSGYLYDLRQKERSQ